MRNILLVIGTIAFGLLLFIGFIIYGFYLMEIEDRYGDYQDVYYDASSGDIILNIDTAEFGMVYKSWKRLYIQTSKNDSIDLYMFATKQSYYSKIEVYKTKLDVEYLNRLNISELQRLINTKSLKLKFKHQNK